MWSWVVRSVGVDFQSLDIHLITVPVLCVDHANDQHRLTNTITAIGPRLLVLDPFVHLR